MLTKLNRIGVLLFALLILGTTSVFAKPVSVYDDSAVTFIDRMNKIATIFKEPIALGDIQDVGQVTPNSPYNVFLATTGKEHPATLALYCNDDGSIAKLNVMASHIDQIALNNAAKVTDLSIVALGISNSERAALFLPFMEGKYEGDVWCNAAKRRIVMQVHGDNAIIITRIIANDEKDSVS